MANQTVFATARELKRKSCRALFGWRKSRHVRKLSFPLLKRFINFLESCIHDSHTNSPVLFSSSSDLYDEFFEQATFEDSLKTGAFIEEKWTIRNSLTFIVVW